MLNVALRRASAATTPKFGAVPSGFALRALQFAGQCWLAAVTLACLPILLQTRSYIPSFVDESDNLLGGSLISHGAVLYRDYFSHHMPLPYWLAAFASLSGASKIQDYRTWTAAGLFAVYLFVVLRFHRRLSTVFLAGTLLTLAASHMLFWENMLLAETIVSCSMLVLFLYFHADALDIGIGDQIIISLLTYAAVMSTLTSVYPLLALVAVYVWQRIREVRHTGERRLRREAMFFGLLALPFGLSAAWLVMNGTMAAFVDQAITFNRIYYSQFDLANDPISILGSAFRGDYHYLHQTLAPANLFNGEGPMILAAALAGAILARRRGLVAGGLYWTLLVLSRLRDEPFHNQAYYVLLSIGVVVVLTGAIEQLRTRVPSLWRELRQKQRLAGLDSARRVAGLLAPAVALGGIVVFYVSLTQTYISSLAYVQPDGYTFQFKDAIDAMTDPGDRIWVGPIDPQAYLAADRLPASRYAFYLPWLAASPEISHGLVSDLENTRPPVIVMPIDIALMRLSGSGARTYSVRQYAQTLAAYLSEAYVPVDSNDPHWKVVFLRRDRSQELLQRLEAAGFYAPVRGADQTTGTYDTRWERGTSG